MYLNIASYFYGKQTKSKLGNKLYLWMIFVYTWITLIFLRVLPWPLMVYIEELRYDIRVTLHKK